MGNPSGCSSGLGALPRAHREVAGSSALRLGLEGQNKFVSGLAHLTPSCLLPNPETSLINITWVLIRNADSQPPTPTHSKSAF